MNNPDRLPRTPEEVVEHYQQSRQKAKNMAALAFGMPLLPAAGGAYFLEHTLSGATARDYAQKHPTATTEQIDANSNQAINDGAGLAIFFL